MLRYVITLGPTSSEFCYYEHPSLRNIFFFSKEVFLLTSIFIKFGYNKYRGHFKNQIVRLRWDPVDYDCYIVYLLIVHVDIHFCQ